MESTSNLKHTNITVTKDEVILTFKSIQHFAEYLEKQVGREINKGHLYNLVNGKSKSYLGYTLV